MRRVPTAAAPPCRSARCASSGRTASRRRPARSGELWVRGPKVVKGYWRKPEATAQTFVDGWVRTGDVGQARRRGLLHIVDRAKDMLIRGGENIYCIEVENALYDHPAVMDAAVVGIPASHARRGAGRGGDGETRRAGQRGGAARLRRRAARGVQGAGEDHPARGILPRNANGKIVKAELRKLFAPSKT